MDIINKYKNIAKKKNLPFLFIPILAIFCLVIDIKSTFYKSSEQATHVAETIDYNKKGNIYDEFRKSLSVETIEPIFKEYIYTDWIARDGIKLCSKIDSLFKDYIDTCFILDVDIKLLVQDVYPEEKALHIEFEKEKYRIEKTQDYIASLNFYHGFWMSLSNGYRNQAEESLMNKYYNLTLSLLEPEDRLLLEKDQKLWIESFESSQAISELIIEPKYRNTGGTIMELFHSSYMSQDRLERIEYLFFWYNHLLIGINDVDKTVYVRYRKPIRGYNFRINYHHNKDSKEWEGTLTVLSLQNEIVYETSFEQSNFGIDGIDVDSLSNGEVIYIDYKHGQKTNYSDFTKIDSKSDPCSVFGFLDVNFDGKEELVIRGYGTGQKHIPLYHFITFPEFTDINLEHEIDSYWQFDKINKRVITYLTCDIGCNSHFIWKWNDEKNGLILLKEMKEADYTDSNKLMTIHKMYKDDEIIMCDSIVINDEDIQSKKFLYNGLIYR